MKQNADVGAVIKHGVVVKIGTSFTYQPVIQFNCKGIKWYKNKEEKR